MAISLHGLAAASEQQRRLTGLVFQVVGLSDIAFGAVIAFLGPGFIGDPSLDGILLAAGGFLAASGIGVLWWGRRRYGPQRDDADSGTVVRTRR